MAKKVKTQSQVKKKKKIWVQINSPKIFGQKKIGETYVFVPGDAVGKTIEQNLMNLTGDMKKQNINIKFRVEKVAGTVAETKIVSYKMAPTYIKRLVRRRRDRIDTSKVYTTKDNVKIRIKPLVITTNKTRGSTLTSLTKMTNALIAKKTKQLTFNALVEEIISFKFQGFLKNNLKKIHPLRNCDIRVFKIEDTKNKTDDVEIEDKSEEETEATEEVKEKKSKAKKETKATEEEKPEAEEETSEEVEESNEDEDTKKSDDEVEESNEDDDTEESDDEVEKSDEDKDTEEETSKEKKE